MTEFKFTLRFFQSVRRGEKIERSEMSNKKVHPRSEFQMTSGSSGGSSGNWVVVVSGNKDRVLIYLTFFSVYERLRRSADMMVQPRGRSMIGDV